jgi:glycosyltransferase involved in cell wall biosynthesis
VIARDAGATIDRCLASLAWCDECVVVLDPRSRDATEARARAAGARVIAHPYAGNVEQKGFAIAQAKSEWVVALDADEALAPELARRLAACLRAPEPGCDGILLNRVAFHLGRWIRHGDFHPDWQLRAFRREGARVVGCNPHGRVRVPGRVVRLAGDLEHRSYASLADQLERVQAYSRIEAEAMFAAGRRAGLRPLVLRPPARFLRAYLLRQGFRDGIPGLVIAAVTAFHVFLKYAKLWELAQQGREAAAQRAAGERSAGSR